MGEEQSPCPTSASRLPKVGHLPHVIGLAVRRFRVALGVLSWSFVAGTGSFPLCVTRTHSNRTGVDLFEGPLDSRINK